MRQLLHSTITAAVLAVGTGFAEAEDVIYISSDVGHLGTLTVPPGTGTPVTVSMLSTSLSDIAFDPDGNLWGVGGSGFDELYTVDATTGTATLVGNMGTPINSLVFDSGGTLYGAYSNLFTINTSTAAVTPVGSGLGYQASGDLAFLGGTLYASGADPGSYSGSDVLLSVNTTTGAASIIGPIGTSGVYGLAVGSDGTLYGGAGPSIITINTTTGAGSTFDTWPTGFNGAFGNVGGMDLITVPVPEPGALSLLSLAGIAGITFLRGRKKE